MRFFVLFFILTIPVLAKKSYLQINLDYWTGIYKPATEKLHFLDNLIGKQSIYNDKWNLSDTGNMTSPLDIAYYKQFLYGYLVLQTTYEQKKMNNIFYKSTIDLNNYYYNHIKDFSVIDWTYFLGFSFGVISNKIVFFPSIGVRNYLKSYQHKFIAYGDDYNLLSAGGKYKGQNSHLVYKTNLSIEIQESLYFELSFSDTLRQKSFLTDLVEDTSKFNQQIVGQLNKEIFFQVDNFKSSYNYYLTQFSIGLSIVFQSNWILTFGGRVQTAKESHMNYKGFALNSIAPYVQREEVLSDQSIYQNEYVSQKKGLYVGIRLKMDLFNPKNNDKKNILNDYKSIYEKYKK